MCIAPMILRALYMCVCVCVCVRTAFVVFSMCLDLCSPVSAYQQKRSWFISAALARISPPFRWLASALCSTSIFFFRWITAALCSHIRILVGSARNAPCAKLAKAIGEFILGMRPPRRIALPLQVRVLEDVMWTKAHDDCDYALRCACVCVCVCLCVFV